MREVVNALSVKNQKRAAQLYKRQPTPTAYCVMKQGRCSPVIVRCLQSDKDVYQCLTMSMTKTFDRKVRFVFISIKISGF